MTEGFDLTAALTGRSYPVTTVSIWLEEEPWYELADLEKKHAGLKADDPEFKATEERMAIVRQQIEETKYRVTIRGISPRAGEDIISKAISEIPYKRDMYGRDDDERTLNRSRLIRQLSFAAHIQKIVNPEGAVVDFTEENRQDRTRAFLGEAPKTAINTVDAAIAGVSKDFAELQAQQQSPDFL